MSKVRACVEGGRTCARAARRTTCIIMSAVKQVRVSQSGVDFTYDFGVWDNCLGWILIRGSIVQKAQHKKRGVLLTRTCP